MPDLLKSVLQDLINDKPEQAEASLHTYLVQKTQEVAGLTEKLWSNDVATHWSPPEGFFSKSASAIASGLKAASESHKQASSRLNFYVNRAGKKLSAEEHTKLKLAGEKLAALYD